MSEDTVKIEMRVVKEPDYPGYYLEYLKDNQFWEYMPSSVCITWWGAKLKARIFRRNWKKRLAGKQYWYV